MDTILFVNVTINGAPVQATMRLPHATAHELRVRLFWRWYEARQHTLEWEYRIQAALWGGDERTKAA